MGTALGDRLRTEREQRGWTLREVERRTGVHNAHLVQIEKGLIERPSLSLLWSLSAVYNLDFDEMVRLAGHVQRETGKSAARSAPGLALHATSDLTPEEQQEVLAFVERLRKRREKGQ